MTDYAEMLDRFDAANAALLQSQAREVGADSRVKELEQKLTDMNAAWQQDMDRASQFLRERDEAREAVKRLAGALGNLTSEMLLRMETQNRVTSQNGGSLFKQARAILSDTIVKRIVEGS